MVSDERNIVLEDWVIFLKKKIFVLNTELAALRSFKIEQLLVIKTMAKEKSTDSSVWDPNKLSHEIKYP